MNKSSTASVSPHSSNTNVMRGFKVCPICKEKKHLDEYDKYFSKERKKYRVQNYCKICLKVEANKRAKAYYQNHKEKILHYQNVERKEWKTEKEIQHRKQLTDRYVLVKLKQTTKGISNKTLRQLPELIEAKRTKILLSRIKKQLNAKK
jgi:hypothetical protein